MTQDLAAMEDHRDALLKELEALRLQLEEEASTGLCIIKLCSDIGAENLVM